MGERVEMYTLKTARDKAGYSQKEAARALGTTVGTLRNYENGKTFPNADFIRKIENLYSVSYDQLIFLNHNNA